MSARVATTRCYHWGGSVIGDPAGYELAYREATRTIETQTASLDGLRGRAGTLITAAALVAGFLGPRSGASAPANFLEFVAGIALVTAAALGVSLLLPLKTWRPTVDAHRLLADYIESDPPASLAEIHRSLAYHMQDDWKQNEDSLKTLNKRLAVAAGAIVVETVAWLIAAHI
jgi:hypothetical protein